MLSKQDIEYVRTVSILAALDDDVVARIVRLASKHTYAKGDLVYQEGEPAKEMIVVLSGRLEIFKRGRNGREARIAALVPGDVVGEMSLVDIQPRSAAVRATEDTAVFVLTHADLAAVYREDPHAYTLLLLNLAKALAGKLARANLSLRTSARLA